MKQFARAVLLACAALLGLPSAAFAQTFPSNDSLWIPMEKAGVPIGDKTGDASNERDIVGSGTVPYVPSAYVYGDGTYLYFRLRVDASPAQKDGWAPFGWAVLLDTNN